MTLHAIDLFCGAGGMSEGILQAGFHILYSNDVNEQVGQTYTNRHEQLGLLQDKNTVFECKDIREVTWEHIKERLYRLTDYKFQGAIEIDAIFGGPPCQGFSRAGKRMKNDPRNFLFKEYLRLIHEIQPKYVVMENVVGLLDTKLDAFEGVFGDIYPDDSLITELLASEFEKIGYNHLEPRVLDASDYGVPQKRKRVIYLAYRKDVTAPSYPVPSTPNPEDKVTVADAIGDLIVDEKYKGYQSTSSYQTASQKGRTVQSETPVIHNHEVSKNEAYITERFSLFQYGESQKDIRNRLTKGFNISNSPVLLEKIKTELYPAKSKKEIVKMCQNEPSEDIVNLILTKKNSRVRLSPFQSSPTVMSSGDDFIHPHEPRGLSVREMARLQSFDDSFEFLGKRTTGGLRRRVEVPQYTQVGNAVPPLMAKEIATEIRNALETQ